MLLTTQKGDLLILCQLLEQLFNVSVRDFGECAVNCARNILHCLLYLRHIQVVRENIVKRQVGRRKLSQQELE